MCNSSGIGGESIRDRSTATCNCQRPRVSVTQTSKHAITVPRAKTGTDARFLVCILLEVVVDIYFKTLKRTHLLPPPPVTNQFRFSKNIGNYGRPLRGAIDKIISSIIQLHLTYHLIVLIRPHRKNCQVRITRPTVISDNFFFFF